jgi:hypothetical protein
MVEESINEQWYMMLIDELMINDPLCLLMIDDF